MKIVRAGNYVHMFLLVLFSITTLLPGMFVVMASFSPSDALNRGELLREFTLANYIIAVQSADFLTLYRNTLLYTIGLLLVQVPTTLLCAYALARLTGVVGFVLFYAVLFQFFLPPAALIIPNFIVISKVGLADTLVGVGLPYVASATGAFLLRQGIRQVPKELEEAAIIDGATKLQILTKVIVPLIKPHIAAFSLVSFVYHWNEFLWPLVVISSPEKRLLSLGFAAFTRSSESGAEWGLIAAGAVLVAAPLILAFALGQRFFIESFTRAGLKG